MSELQVLDLRSFSCGGGGACSFSDPSLFKCSCAMQFQDILDRLYPGLELGSRALRLRALAEKNPVLAFRFPGPVFRSTVTRR